MSFSNYMLEKTKKECAEERYNYAQAALELARIKERLAEIKSQHEPLNSLIDEPMTERQRLYSIAFYVAIGRWPHGGDP